VSALDVGVAITLLVYG